MATERGSVTSQGLQELFHHNARSGKGLMWQWELGFAGVRMLSSSGTPLSSGAAVPAASLVFLISAAPRSPARRTSLLLLCPEEAEVFLLWAPHA